MTKYNEAVVERAAEVGYERAAVECQAAWGEVREEIRQPWRDDAIAIFDTLERAPWWREVGLTYVVKAGQRFRIEIHGSSADERTSACDMRVNEIMRRNGRFFVDTRWQPEPEPLKVGDVIETVEDAERFTAYEYGKAAVIDRDGDVWRTAGKGHLNLDSGKNAVVDVLRNYGPLTVVHVPAVDK